MAPQAVLETRKYSKRLYVAAEGSHSPEILFVATAVGDEEAATKVATFHGRHIPQQPRYLRGPAGCILKDMLGSLGIDIDQQCYTALVKYLLPKPQRMKPKRPDIEIGLPILDEEIRRLNPRIIVTFGKPAFEAVMKLRIRFDVVEACWFQSEEYSARVFALQDVYLPVLKPELLETFRTNLLDVVQVLQETRGLSLVKPPLDTGVIHTAAELQAFVERLEAESAFLLSVDCEWGGLCYRDMRVRSLQICWTPGKARYIRFMDDQENYVFDVPYAEAGRILAQHLNNPVVKFIGHHISADLPVMHYGLGIEWYNKTVHDTEFAEQNINENGKFGVERIALKYTKHQRYDIDLILWRNAHKDQTSDDLGYLRVPDDILIPYALLDVLVPMEAMPQQIARMQADNGWQFYLDYVIPMVGNMFTLFTLTGLPVKMSKLDGLRDLYTYARGFLEQEFIEEVVKESRVLLLNRLLADCDDPTTALAFFHNILTAKAEDQKESAFDEFKNAVGPTNVLDALPTLEHFWEAPEFNLRSAPAKVRWLFKVKGLMPIKSTNNKEKGLPSTTWDRVLKLPLAKQKLYSPSADKQSMKLLADETSDPVLVQLMDVLAEGNVCKAFLKPAEGSEENRLWQSGGSVSP